MDSKKELNKYMKNIELDSIIEKFQFQIYEFSQTGNKDLISGFDVNINHFIIVGNPIHVKKYEYITSLGNIVSLRNSYKGGYTHIFIDDKFANMYESTLPLGVFDKMVQNEMVQNESNAYLKRKEMNG